MKIIFFDGYCSLCNSAVDWLMKRDRRQQLQFASLQGATAQTSLPTGRESTGDPDTVVYLRDGKKLERSTAILTAVSDLGGIWSIARWLLIVPEPIRNIAYRFVATNRYRFFKRRDTCRIPTDEEKDRLLP